MYFVNMSQFDFKHPLVINLTGKYKSYFIFASPEKQLEILKDFLENEYNSDGHKISRLKRTFSGVMMLTQSDGLFDLCMSKNIQVKSLHEIIDIYDKEYKL